MAFLLASLFLERFGANLEYFAKSHKPVKTYISSPYARLILQRRRTALCQSKNKRRDVGLVWELLAPCYKLLICAYSKV